jgi:ABC-2 type transport system ATP-binding protein
LTKIYETGVKGLDELSLSIERGTSFGLMGENGAGKSTLVRLLMGFILPTSGELKVLGQTRIQHAHSQIGYLHERPFVELRFSGKRYLSYMAELSGLSGSGLKQRVEAVLEQVDLTSAAGERLSTYSKGMLQRICIAQALLTDPQLLILDEPTSGLDPYSQWKVRQIIEQLRREGKTILLCTHHVAEVETLCDTVGILKRGRLARYGTVAELLRPQNLFEIMLGDTESAPGVIKRLGLAGQVVRQEGNLLQVPAAAQPEVLKTLLAANVPIQSVNPVTRSLEEVYISATQPDAEAALIARELAGETVSHSGKAGSR